MPIAIDAAVERLTFLADRTPTTTDDEAANAFTMVSEYRDGGVFVGHWAGVSEWEHHAADEVVLVLDGATTITFRDEDPDGPDASATLGPRELVVVPQGTWHRFETPVGVKILSVTPQPTEGRPDRPV